MPVSSRVGRTTFVFALWNGPPGIAIWLAGPMPILRPFQIFTASALSMKCLLGMKLPLRMTVIGEYRSVSSIVLRKRLGWWSYGSWMRPYRLTRISVPLGDSSGTVSALIVRDEREFLASVVLWLEGHGPRGVRSRGSGRDQRGASGE